MARKVKKKQRKNNDKDEMELVDIYYIPKVIAPHFKLLRQHCMQEVISILEKEFSEVKVTTLKEEIGEVVVAYHEDQTIAMVVELDPMMISKLEKEISAERLEKFLLGE